MVNINNMNEKTQIKFTDDELAELRDLQLKYQQNILKFGELNIERLAIETSIANLKVSENELKQEYSSLQKQEQSLIDKIIAKYGEG